MKFRRLKALYHQIFIQMRRLRLKNHNFSIISNNCCGGIIYHDLGEQFCSPTINLAIDVEDFMVFLENYNECLEREIKEVDSEESYPVGCITLYDGRSIIINFMHYTSFAEATKKWNERKERIDKNNLFVFFEMGINTSDELVERFERLQFDNKIAITNKSYPYGDTCFIDIYNDYQWGKLIKYMPRTLHTKQYLNQFDYIRWLNEGRKALCQ